jgi:heat shock protein HtpX
MSLLKLRMSIIGTLALLIAISTLFFTIILSIVGITNIVALAFFVILFNIVQWLIAPYLINSMYQTKEVSKSDKLYSMVARLSQKLDLKMPKVMIANIPIPNAFAYGSPIAGNKVAVTKGLINELEEEEIEAVVGHELGHIKNKDVQVMMFASILPAIFYFIGFSFMMSSFYGGARQRQGGGAAPILIGMACMAIYWILTLFTLGLSRLREYYADRRSCSIVDDGGRKLSEALAKIVSSSSKLKRTRQTKSHLNSFKALFIEDPDSVDRDEVAISGARMFKTDQQLVNEILSKKVSSTDRLLELLSTHPNMVKRIQALQKLS